MCILLRVGGFFDGTARRQRVARRRGVEELCRSLALIVDPEGIETCVAARVRELFGAERVVILQPDAGREALAPRSPAGDLERIRIDLRGRLAKWLQTNEAPLVVRLHAGAFSYLDPAEREMLREFGVEVCVPMISLNRLSGAMLLAGGRMAARLGRKDLELLQLLASQAALALENAANYRREKERLLHLHRAERLAAAGQLAANIAHEIRNPLTAIRSTIQYIVQGLSEEDPKRVLAEESLAEVDRINQTIAGLLNLAQPPRGELREIDPVGPLEQALSLVAVQAAAQGVTVERRLEGAARVLGDPGQLKELFLNLLLNALQAMPSGGEIRVALQCSPEGGKIRIDVSDSGRGIRRQHIERIFDPFFTTRPDGTGLGLAICRGIVERHGGGISVRSEEGKGTTVSVLLPQLTGKSDGEDPARR